MSPKKGGKYFICHYLSAFVFFAKTIQAIALISESQNYEKIVEMVYSPKQKFYPDLKMAQALSGEQDW